MIQVKKLIKYYGKHVGILDVSFEIYSGEIFGLIGTNGAGKTTCINCLCGLLDPSNGQIIYDNKRYTGEENEIKRNLGVVPEVDFLFDYLSVDEQLSYTGRAFGLSKDVVERRKTELYEIFSYHKTKSKLITELSKGNRKLASFMNAVIHGPKYLILDELLDGLDVIFANMIKKILIQMKNSGVHILISSHNFNFIEELCDRVGILLEGKLVFVGTKEEIRKNIFQSGKDADRSVLEKYILSLVGEEERSGLSWVNLKENKEI